VATAFVYIVNGRMRPVLKYLRPHITAAAAAIYPDTAMRLKKPWISQNSLDLIEEKVLPGFLEIPAN